ncbi:FK506-binding protein 15 isoform X2 [Nematostella vectensis]|uniref:FK506-binding protein 15 isoform X2 n=1 Tax=Nematostella vectensis TaxID=45351 RepID=UPI0020774EB1|nr:FK506-binding protein 15 isoform X2 [Nematostella vectensis]
MFSVSSEDDDGTFSPPMSGSSSKLASLFGQDRASFTGGNESLTYTAPKQPKKEKPAAQASSDAPAVVFAAAVYAYKYVNGQHTSQGKLGAAILANHTSCDYKILLYASKQQQVATSQIHAQFVFTVQDNNYASFCDDQRQRWSICFDSEKNANRFAKQIGLLTFNSSPTSLIMQDLHPGEGQAIETGDAVEVKYTGWLLENGNFGKVFDSNAGTDKTFKFKTGKGKVIKGWDQGVIGMKKGGKRFIGIPASLAYASKGVPGRVPSESPLLFEVEVLRIKFKDGSTSESLNSSRTESPVTIQEPSPSPSPGASGLGLPNITAEPSGVKTRSDSASSSSSIKGRTASLSEQLSQSPGKNSDKARLLARMSKMGKNVLTIPGAVAAEAEEEETLEEVTSPSEEQPAEPTPEEHVEPEPTLATGSSNPHHHGNPHPHGNPRPKPQLPQRPTPIQPHPEVQQTMGAQSIRQGQQPLPSYSAPQQLAVYQTPPMSTQGMAMPPQYYPQPPVYQSQVYTQPVAPAPPPVNQPSTSDAMVPVLMAETRQQQSEVRMAINKVSEKVDKMLHKFDRLQGPSSLVPAYQQPSGAALDPATLLTTITRIVQENEKLKTENVEQSKKIDVLNEKVSDLLQKNQRFVEKSNQMMEQSSDSLQHNSAANQARLITLEQEKSSISSEATVLKTQLANAQTELQSLRKQEAEMRTVMNKATSESERFRVELESLKESLSESQLHTEKLKQDLKEEKQTRKRVESRADHVEEEMADLQHEKDKLEKSVADRKKKHTQDRRKFEEELEELRAQHEDEIKSLKEKHRREKKNSGSVTTEEISKMESDLETRWTEKATKMVSQAVEKWKRKYDDVIEERDEAARKLTTLEDKLSSLKSIEEKKNEEVNNLQEKIDELQNLQEKFTSATSTGQEKDVEIERLKIAVQELEEAREKMRTKTLQMKTQFEEQLQATEEENEQAVSESYQKGLAQGRAQASRSQAPSQDVVTEVKKIMNNVFHELKAEFAADTQYTGAEIMAVILRTIKEMTLRLINPNPEDEGVDEEDDDKDEVDEEEEEEEEDEEDEKEDEDEEQEEDEVHDKDEDSEGEREPQIKDNGVRIDTVKDTLNELNVCQTEDYVVKQKHDIADKDEDEEEEEEAAGEKHENKSELKQSNTDQINNENINVKSNTDSLTRVDQVVHEAESEDTKTSEDVEHVTIIDVTDDNLQDEHLKHESGEDKVIEAVEGTEQLETVEQSPEIFDTPDQSKHDEEVTRDQRGSDVSSESDQEHEGPPPLDDNEDVQSAHEPSAETADPPKNLSPSDAVDASDKLKSLFGDDSHDDVKDIFVPKPKIDLTDEPPSKPIPPPLFDDDDEDDDIDWFK